jgi:hypothetical protein
VRLWCNFDDIILIVWFTCLGSLWLGVFISIMAAASAFVTALLVRGFFSFALHLITFLLGLLFSFVVLGGHGLGVPLISPFVLGLQLLWVIVDVEEIEVAVLVVTKLVGLGLDPGGASQLIVVQELVAQNVLSLDVGHNKLSSGLPSISEWVGTRSISVSVKQFEHDLLALAVGSFSSLDTDEDGLVIISDVDEGLGSLIPEEEAVFSSLVSLDPEPSRLELKFGVFIEDSGVAKIRSSSLSLLSDVESFVRHQEIIL